MSEYRYEIGHYAVVSGSFDGMLNPSMIKIADVTEKLIKSVRYGGRMSHTPKGDVLAVFETQEEAGRLINTLVGIRGEKSRRVQAASAAAIEQARAAIAAALARKEGVSHG